MRERSAVDSRNLRRQSATLAALTLIAMLTSACDEKGLRLGWFADPQPTPTPTVVAPVSTQPVSRTQPDPSETPGPVPTPTARPGDSDEPDRAPGPEPGNGNGNRNGDGAGNDDADETDEARIERLIALADKYRAHNGLASLSVNPILSMAAQDFAEELARAGELRAASESGANAGTRLLEAGVEWSEWGENLASGFDSAEDVMAAWTSSGAHRANLLHDGFTEVGVGFSKRKSTNSRKAQTYWVIEFAAPQRQENH